MCVLQKLLQTVSHSVYQSVVPPKHFAGLSLSGVLFLGNSCIVVFPFYGRRTRRQFTGESHLKRYISAEVLFLISATAKCSLSYHMAVQKCGVRKIAMLTRHTDTPSQFRFSPQDTCAPMTVRDLVIAPTSLFGSRKTTVSHGSGSCSSGKQSHGSDAGAESDTTDFGAAGGAAPAAHATAAPTACAANAANDGGKLTTTNPADARCTTPTVTPGAENFSQHQPLYMRGLLSGGEDQRQTWSADAVSGLNGDLAKILDAAEVRGMRNLEEMPKEDVFVDAGRESCIKASRELWPGPQAPKCREVRRGTECYNCGMMGLTPRVRFEEGKARTKGKAEMLARGKFKGKGRRMTCTGKKGSGKSGGSKVGYSREQKRLGDTQDGAGHVAKSDTSPRSVDVR